MSRVCTTNLCSTALVLTCALFAASCVRGSDDSPADELCEPQSSALAEPTGEAQQGAHGARFTPGDFEPGGSQIAYNNLRTRASSTERRSTTGSAG